MKKTRSLLLMLALLFGGAAQLRTQNPSTVLSANGRQVLFTGIPNRLDVAVPGIPFSSLSFTFNGKPVPVEQGAVVLTPRAPGIGRLVISQGARTIDALQFTVVSLPDPRAHINSKTGGSISLAELLLAKGLSIRPLPDPALGYSMSPEGNPFMLTRFTLVCYTKDGYLVKASSHGAQFTTEMISIFKMNIGRTIVFDDIEARGASFCTRKLNPLTFKIAH